ncbi:MAG TPA: polyprenyl synthetase family protein [Candidatus Merdenecus merdavium]|nr:polyprenyl synthetase family protein [Candidatus Merdenecus merdavium]
MNVKEEMRQKAENIQKMILTYLPKEEGLQKTIFEAMHYSMSSGGKKLRPMLMEETYRMFGGTQKVIEPFMAAIEMIHTYSLIHDDLPAMDNDDYRRGRKTTHIIYGEAMGILAGDGLLNYAFETACQAFSMPGDIELTAKAIRILSKKSGVFGMIGGQTVDIESEGKNIDGKTLDFIFRLKTAALIEASMMIGATLAGATQEEIEVIEKIATLVGISFQIQDDILDVTSTVELLGKPINSDEKNHKTTYVTLHGIEAAKRDALKMAETAMELLDSLPKNNEFLRLLILQLVYREN